MSVHVRFRQGALLAGLSLMATGLNGCVVAAIPIAASSAVIARKTMGDIKEGRIKRKGRLATPTASAAAEGQSGWQVVTGAAGLPPPSGATAAANSATGSRPGVPAAMQYLYGSGEAAAGSRQAYGALARYLTDFGYRKPDSLRQLVMSDGASLTAPYFEPCAKKPPAIVLDIDETALLNLGYEADEAARGLNYDDARWRRWEAGGASAVVAVPGAREVVAQARKAGVAVIFNSNRTAGNAAATETALNSAGLGPAKHGETLWLKGDDGGGSGKDDRRWAIATGYCVIALVGDQLGDFSDLFNDAALTPAQRRAAADAPGIAELWGNGWFVLPNPVYGTALKGGLDDVFPADKRWVDPGSATKSAKE